jgi:hypothetical protein
MEQLKKAEQKRRGRLSNLSQILRESQKGFSSSKSIKTVS